METPVLIAIIVVILLVISLIGLVAYGQSTEEEGTPSDDESPVVTPPSTQPPITTPPPVITPPIIVTPPVIQPPADILPPLIPGNFSGKHLNVMGTDLYLAYADDYQAGANLKFTTYANTDEQQFSFNGGTGGGVIMIATDKGIGLNNRYKCIRWGTNGDPAQYSGYYCLLWSGYASTDVWYTDGYYFYNQSYSDYMGVPYHLAMVIAADGRKLLMCVGPDDVGSFPIVPV